ncbi:hypothetical protein V6N13_078085 [Hibiscus sabdariffa]
MENQNGDGVFRSRKGKDHLAFMNSLDPKRVLLAGVDRLTKPVKLHAAMESGFGEEERWHVLLWRKYKNEKEKIKRAAKGSFGVRLRLRLRPQNSTKADMKK